MKEKEILLKEKDIIKWINENQSKAFICKEIGCKPATLEKYLSILNINYKGNRGLKGIKVSNKRNHVSVYLFNGSTINSHKLKNKLIRDGYKERLCEECKLTHWNEKEIPLEIHHIDGNRFNNELSNLKILCPNCHAQTDNYSGKSNRK